MRTIRTGRKFLNKLENGIADDVRRVEPFPHPSPPLPRRGQSGKRRKILKIVQLWTIASLLFHEDNQDEENLENPDNGTMVDNVSKEGKPLPNPPFYKNNRHKENEDEFCQITNIKINPRGV